MPYRQGTIGMIAKRQNDDDDEEQGSNDDDDDDDADADADDDDSEEDDDHDDDDGVDDVDDDDDDDNEMLTLMCIRSTTLVPVCRNHFTGILLVAGVGLLSPLRLLSHPVPACLQCALNICARHPRVSFCMCCMRCMRCTRARYVV